jgi:hypothetical protein
MHYRSSAVLTPCMDGMARCARHGMEDPRTYGTACPGPLGVPSSPLECPFSNTGALGNPPVCRAFALSEYH